jgi:hypothetical protein
LTKETSITLSPFSSIEQFEDAHKMADLLMHSRFVPQTFRGSLPDCMMALQIANRLGSDPLSVMNAMFDVYGNIGFKSKFLIATVNASSRFTPIRWRTEGKIGSDDWRYQAYAKDIKSDEVLPGPWVSIKMAKDEGWYDKKGSKWKTMPEVMLRYRSASFWISMFAPEYAMGMRTQEDLQDEVHVGPAIVQSAPTAPPKNLDELMEHVAPAELAPAEPFESPKQEPDPMAIMTELAEKKYGAQYRGVVNKICAEQLGIHVPDMGDLNDNQCSAVVDFLQQVKQPKHEKKGGVI